MSVKLRTGAWCAALTGAVLALAPEANAQAQAGDPLVEAESAYERIEFDVVRTAARRALERGGYERRQTARIYFLLAVSAASAGDEDAAREAASRVLALDPEERASRNLSPQLRGPFLEARGYWSSRPDRLRVTARYDRDGQRLAVSVSDPLHMVRSLTVRSRVGAGPFVAAQLAPAPSVFAPRAARPSDAVALVVRAVDEHNNVVAEQGTEDDPVVSAALSSGGSVAGPASSGPARASVPLLAAGGVGLGLGAVGVVLGGVFTSIYESNAAQWNDDSRCLAADGSTREQTCGSSRVAAEGARPVAIAGFVVGGALLAVGAGLLIAGAPRNAESPRRAARSVVCMPDPTGGVVCGGAF